MSKEFDNDIIVSQVIRCPWPPRIKKQESKDLVSKISFISKSYNKKPFLPLGIDILLSCIALEENYPDSAESDPHRELMLRRLMFRPLAYPIIYSYFPRFFQFDFNNEVSEQFVTMLNGRVSLTRTEDVFSFPDKNNRIVIFPNSNISRYWLNYVNQIVQDTNVDYLAKAIICYAVIALLHPFCNGNGRLARAFFHGILHKSGHYSCPFLPIDFAYSLSAKEIVKALRDLSLTGNWQEFYDEFLKIVYLSIDCHARYTQYIKRITE